MGGAPKRPNNLLRIYCPHCDDTGSPCPMLLLFIIWLTRHLWCCPLGMDDLAKWAPVATAQTINMLDFVPLGIGCTQAWPGAGCKWQADYQRCPLLPA